MASALHIIGLDHVQLAMPADKEAEAHEFYAGLLGLAEIAKPKPLASRGGCWFEGPGTAIYLGVQDGFVPAQKAHPAFLVKNLDALRQSLEMAGVRVVIDRALPDVKRFYVADPFGNRLEFIQARDGFSQTQ
jgi:catechol 2,3-dioxygenase-like lactoylglutathione lyase family enzyme